LRPFGGPSRNACPIPSLKAEVQACGDGIHEQVPRLVSPLAAELDPPLVGAALAGQLHEPVVFQPVRVEDRSAALVLSIEAPVEFVFDEVGVDEQHGNLAARVRLLAALVARVRVLDADARDTGLDLALEQQEAMVQALATQLAPEVVGVRRGAFLTARVADHELDRHEAAAVLKLVLAQDALVANQVPIFEVGAGLHPCVLLRPLVDARGLDDREAVDDLDVVQRAVGNDPVDLYLPSVRLYVDLRDPEANAVRGQRAVPVALLRRAGLHRASPP